MPTDPRIEDARQQFARSLVGCWSSAQGTFDIVMGKYWEFHEDGTGRAVDTGCFGHPRGETRFEWRQSADFEIELKMGEYVPSHPDDAVEAEADEGHDDEEEEDEWLRYRYDFEIIEHDCGREVALVGIVEYFNTPLSYCGPIRDSVAEVPAQRSPSTTQPQSISGPTNLGQPVSVVFTLVVFGRALLVLVLFWFIVGSVALVLL
ncbi:MAG: hypothetical protein ACRC8S_02450 [Fimbriiglobus sp.]